jgi:guanosine-3',5'-bis(diphosphate) 3'-pyrophosphohydrolase
VITARDRSGLIRDIAAVVSEIGVNMTSVSSNVSLGKEIAVISTTLEIDGLEQMQRVFARLEKVKGVLLVERDLGKHKKK